MKINKLLSFALLVGLVGLGVSFLLAAQAVDGDKAKEKNAPAPEVKANGTNNKLVCLGHADTEAQLIKILPDNFPQQVRLSKILVQEGAEVTKGQPLLEFVDDLVESNIRKAQLGVEAAKKQVAKAEAAIKSHPALVNSAEFEVNASEEEIKNKRAEFEESKRLNSIGTSNKTEVEAREAAVRSAELKLQAAKWKVQALKDSLPTADLELAKANVALVENNVEQAMLAKKYLTCTAPVDGTIIRSFVTDGVNFGQQTREPAFWLLPESPLIVRAEINQEFVRRISRGQTARIDDETDPSLTWKGRVVKISDYYLPKRNGANPMSDLLGGGSDEKVLECLISIEPNKNNPPPRYGQKLRITVGEE
jgi:multidrug resistance efflux pump